MPKRIVKSYNINTISPNIKWESFECKDTTYHLFTTATRKIDIDQVDLKKDSRRISYIYQNQQLFRGLQPLNIKNFYYNFISYRPTFTKRTIKSKNPKITIEWNK